VGFLGTQNIVECDTSDTERPQPPVAVPLAAVPAGVPGR